MFTMAQHSTFDIHPCENPLSEAERNAILAAPGFGQYFTDHMVAVSYTHLTLPTT